jgi:signal transduction histidine kinase/CheY-like chemotaxis protein
MISGSVGEELAVRAMKAGAHDYFMKGQLGLLVPAIQRELREAELRRLSREQREQLFRNEKLAAMGMLLAAVAHELNNPLAVVMAQATLLQKTLKGDPRQARSDKIVQAAERCARIVRNFLALARHQPPERSLVSVNEIVQEAVELLAYSLRSDSVDVVFDLAASVPAVWADPHQLQQVVINLVSNAHYALSSRSGIRRLTLSSAVDAPKERVIVRVTDNAGGIPPEIRSRIFEPFFTTKPEGQGTGLGLALCQGIVQGHGGSISVESETGLGTTFTIELPSASLTQVNHPVAHTPANLTSRQILVVDDEPEVADAIAEMLIMMGHRVDAVAEAKSALQLLDESPYEVVISDMRMPGVDGPTLYRQIIAGHPDLERRFVFLTGDTFRPETQQFFEETQAVHLIKPCTFDELATAVQQLFD